MDEEPPFILAGASTKKKRGIDRVFLIPKLHEELKSIESAHAEFTEAVG